jgi:hypothetical protein
LYFVNTPEPGFAQSDSIASNSFEKWYQQNNPSLHYSFNAEKQVHNYSGNWDLDNDGHKDQVFFIGTGGAHLYFYLRVILSTDNKTQNFTFLETDFPLLDADSIILKPNFNPVFSEANFAVYDNLFSKTTAIFLRLNDAVFSTEKDTLKKKGITTNTIVLCFKKGKPVFKNGNK